MSKVYADVVEIPEGYIACILLGDGFAVFTNQLEKEFSVEVAHLGADGKLHRIYRLDY